MSATLIETLDNLEKRIGGLEEQVKALAGRAGAIDPNVIAQKAEQGAMRGTEEMRGCTAKLSASAADLRGVVAAFEEANERVRHGRTRFFVTNIVAALIVVPLVYVLGVVTAEKVVAFAKGSETVESARVTPETTQETEKTEDTRADAPVLGRMLDAVEVPPGKVGLVELSLVEFVGATPRLIFGVMLRGRARAVEVESKLYGQVVVSSVAREDKEVAIAGDGLAGQFDLLEPAIEAGREVVLDGNMAALLAAVVALAENGQGSGVER